MTEALREQALYFPATTLAALQREAARLERSVSWCLQRAWTLARAQVQQFAPDEPDDDGTAGPEDRRKQTVLLPEATLREIRDEAARLDRSLSFVACRAWSLAAPAIATLTSDNPRT